MGQTSASARLYYETADPTVNSDSSAGYEVGNFWYNTITGAHFQAKDVAVGAAVWDKFIINGGSADLPTISQVESLVGFNGATNLEAGTTATNSLSLRAFDTGGAAYTTFATLTSNNPPTFTAAITTLTVGASGAPTITSGSGAPASSQPKGSLYLRTDGTTTNDRSYIATDSIGGWTAIITAT